MFKLIKKFNNKLYGIQQQIFDIMYDKSIFSKDICIIIVDYAEMTQKEWMDLNKNTGTCVIL